MVPPSSRSRRTRILAAGIAFTLVVAGAAWGVWTATRPEVPPDPLADYSPDRLRDLAREDPGNAWRTMRDTMDRSDLTDDQRRQIAMNMRDAFDSMLQERVDEYYNATPEQKDEVLDRHIDEFQQRRREFEERREQERPRDDATTNNDEERRDRWRRSFRDMSQAERKTRSETRNPDERARRMAYFSAVRNRMQQRGLQPPGGPGGRGGFFGGGRRS